MAIATVEMSDGSRCQVPVKFVDGGGIARISRYQEPTAAPAEPQAAGELDAETQEALTTIGLEPGDFAVNDADEVAVPLAVFGRMVALLADHKLSLESPEGAGKAPAAVAFAERREREKVAAHFERFSEDYGKMRMTKPRLVAAFERQRRSQPGLSAEKFLGTTKRR